jgi:hypothetical protein
LFFVTEGTLRTLCHIGRSPLSPAYTNKCSYSGIYRRKKGPLGEIPSDPVKASVTATKDDLDDNAQHGVDPDRAIKESLEDNRSAPKDHDNDEDSDS